MLIISTSVTHHREVVIQRQHLMLKNEKYGQKQVMKQRHLVQQIQCILLKLAHNSHPPSIICPYYA